MVRKRAMRLPQVDTEDLILSPLLEVTGAVLERIAVAEVGET